MTAELVPTGTPRPLRITVFGATGDVGSRVVAEALARGHQVTAVIRRASSSRVVPAAADPRRGDVGRIGDVVRLSTGRDVVISATRPPAGHEDELVATTRVLLAGLARTGVRLLLVGGAGGLIVPGTRGRRVIDDPRYLSADHRAIAQAGIDQLGVCRAEAGVDWAYLSPPALLQPGRRTGRYRVGGDHLLRDAGGGSSISLEDLAVGLLDEAEHPVHHRARFTLAY